MWPTTAEPLFGLSDREPLIVGICGSQGAKNIDTSMTANTGFFSLRTCEAPTGSLKTCLLHGHIDQAPVLKAAILCRVITRNALAVDRKAHLRSRQGEQGAIVVALRLEQDASLSKGLSEPSASESSSPPSSLESLLMAWSMVAGASGARAGC